MIMRRVIHNLCHSATVCAYTRARKKQTSCVTVPQAAICTYKKSKDDTNTLTRFSLLIGTCECSHEGLEWTDEVRVVRRHDWLVRVIRRHNWWELYADTIGESCTHTIDWWELHVYADTIGESRTQTRLIGDNEVRNCAQVVCKVLST